MEKIIRLVAQITIYFCIACIGVSFALVMETNFAKYGWMLMGLSVFTIAVSVLLQKQVTTEKYAE